jgi:hypothetical protein
MVKAEEVMRRIVETYKLSNIDFRNLGKGRRTRPICFGSLAKLAVKTYASKAWPIGQMSYSANSRGNSLWL